VDGLVQQRRAVRIAVLDVIARLGAVIVVVLEPEASLDRVEADEPLALGGDALARAVDAREAVLQPLGAVSPATIRRSAL
jgi:hypothetical protein